MHRDVIHPEFPFTEAENAAAWILLGTPADDAIQEMTVLRAALTAELDDDVPDPAGESGWFYSGPRIRFFGDFGPAIHLAADISSGGMVLSDTARAAWLQQWTARVSAEEAERRAGGLDRLGSEWREHHAAFVRLLTSGTL